MINFDKVFKRYPGNMDALQNINLEILPADLVFVTGPSGAGKSTLLKLISSVEKPTSGTIIFENRNLSTFSDLPIKYLIEDALKFVHREIRRGNKYDGIILDPPKYGRGPNGEKWELQKDLPTLLNLLPKLLSAKPLFVILNSYAIRSSYLSLHYALKEVMKIYEGKIESGEISIFEDQPEPRGINTAIFARWENEKP